MAEAAIFLLKTVLGILSLAFVLRFYLQLVRATPRNPLSAFVYAITDFLVVPARRFIPGLFGYDLSTLILALITEMLLLIMVLILTGANLQTFSLMTILGIFCLSSIALLKTFIYIVIVVTFAQAILSWVNPYSPVMPLLAAMSSPFLDVIRRRLQPIGGVDLSPLVLLVVCQLILTWPIESLYRSVIQFLM